MERRSRDPGRGPDLTGGELRFCKTDRSAGAPARSSGGSRSWWGLFPGWGSCSSPKAPRARGAGERGVRLYARVRVRVREDVASTLSEGPIRANVLTRVCPPHRSHKSLRPPWRLLGSGSALGLRRILAHHLEKCVCARALARSSAIFTSGEKGAQRRGSFPRRRRCGRHHRLDVHQLGRGRRLVRYGSPPARPARSPRRRGSQGVSVNTHASHSPAQLGQGGALRSWNAFILRPSGVKQSSGISRMSGRTTHANRPFIGVSGAASTGRRRARRERLAARPPSHPTAAAAAAARGPASTCCS